MRTLISLSLKKHYFPLVKFLWKIQSFYTKKYDTELWLDVDGNSLAHYACLNHDSQLWNFSKNKPLNLKHLNNAGKAPIHIFIERCFVQKIKKTKYLTIKNFLIFVWLYLLNKFKPNIDVDDVLHNHTNENNLIAISFNKELLTDLIASGADINQFLDYPERKELGWVSTDYGSFSRKDNMGSPLELLVYYFWEFILYPTVKSKNENVVEEYYDFFQFLTSLGANPNLIVQGNTNDKEITDAMNSYPSRIVSIFFIKFIAEEIDYFAIRPFLVDENTNFKLGDDQGSTVLHTLFARISAKKHKFSDTICYNIITDLVKNKSITTEALQLKNNFNMSPIELLRGDALHLRKLFDSFFLHENLNESLKLKNNIKDNKGINKI